MGKREGFDNEVEEMEMYNGRKIVESLIKGLIIFSIVLLIAILVLRILHLG